MMTLEQFLTEKADSLAPLDSDWADFREYAEHTNPDALSDAWLKSLSSYIWKVGVLAQWDSNKCDYAWLFIGHERKPGNFDFIGMLHWRDGENDDPGRCLVRALDLAAGLHPIWEDR